VGLVLLVLGAVITHLLRKDPIKVAPRAVAFFVA
jgi:VIT1/CCC1 family predicted Fe2+/Mn2+ transporter